MFRIQRMRSVGTRNRTVGVSGYSTTPIAPILYGASFLITNSPQYCCSDASHTVPCNNGDSITTWYEQITKTWFTWSQLGAASAKPVFGASGSVYSSNFATLCGFPFANSWPQGDVSIVMRFTPNAKVGHYLGEGGDSGDKPYTFYRATTTGNLQRFNTGPQIALTNGADTYFSYQGTGTAPTSTEKMRVGGGAWVTVSNTRPTRTATSATIGLGTGSAGTAGFSGFKGLAVFSKILIDAQFTAVEAYLNSL